MCVFQPMRTAKEVSERLNIRTSAGMKAFLGAKGYSGVMSFLVPPDATYDASITQRAQGKAPARRHELNQVPAYIRERMPLGHVWWTDLSNPHVADYQGAQYARMFAEERTGYVRLLFCATKSTADLLGHLLQMERWVTKMVPGGRFMVIRSDFGSELVRQGHGNDLVVEALSQWCAMRPGFRVWPVAPNSPSQNKTENSWGRVHGHAFCNTLRSRTGMFIPPDSPGLVAPVSVQAAMRGSEWDVPHGWRVTRVEGFRGWRMVSGRDVRALRRDYPTQVSMGNIVAVLTVKRDPPGNQREIDVVRKLRVAISGPSSKDSVDVESYSSCVDPMSNIIITAVAPALRAEQTSIDVGGAYWHAAIPRRQRARHLRPGPCLDVRLGRRRLQGAPCADMMCGSVQCIQKNRRNS